MIRSFSSLLVFSIVIVSTLIAEENPPCGHHVHGEPSFDLRESVIDSAYHTYEEVNAILDSLADLPELESVIEVMEIGRSTNEDLPIKAIKISDNPTVNEDEASLLFLGQCHAEEILGLEVCMGLIDTLVNGYQQNVPHIMALVQNLEIWIVPTHNPEGLRVVHSGLDVTYRKNKTDCNNNGEFDFVEGIGWDIDGVDLNRQYDFNWVFGDAYEQGDYDYFRGFEPESETEIHAVQALAYEHDFMFSVAYHSARSGTPEIVYYSWEWEESKYPPDFPIISEIGEELGARIINELGEGNYDAVPGRSRRGNAHDWFYTQTGCIQFLVEVGTNNLQPDAPIIHDTVQRNLVGCFYLLDRALGFPPESRSQIRGIVRDESDSFPMEGAEVKIYRHEGAEDPVPFEGLMMAPRLTDEYGRYRRVLQPGTYTVIASAPGFESDTVESVATSDSYWTDLDFALTPAPEKSFTLILPPLEGTSHYRLILSDPTRADTTLLTAGNYLLNWQGNHVDLHLSADYHFPEMHHLDLAAIPDSMAFELHIDLPTASSAYSTGFDHIDDWTADGGEWWVGNSQLRTQQWFTHNELEDTRLLSDPFALNSWQRIAISIDHAYEMEWGIDTLILEVLDDASGEVLLQKSWFDQHYDMHNELIFTAKELPEFGRLALYLKSDSTVNFRGWIIDSLTVLISEEELVATDGRLNERRTQQDFAQKTRISPNPVRQSANIYFETPTAQIVSLEIYDLLGRQVLSQTVNSAAGENVWHWQGRDARGSRVSAGVYFLRLSSTDLLQTRKLMVLAP